MVDQAEFPLSLLEENTCENRKIGKLAINFINVW